MASKNAREMTVDAFADEWGDESPSGVRTREPNDLTIVFLSDPAEQPAPVYAVVSDGAGTFHSYYLGMLHPAGMMVAEGWEEPLQRDGVAPRSIESVYEWIAARTF